MNNGPSPLAIVIGVFVTLAVIAGIIVGGWKLNWWLASSVQTHQNSLAKQNATQQYQIQQNGVSNQDTTRQNITNGFDTLLHLVVEEGAYKSNPSEAEAIQSEVGSEAATICGFAANISGVSLPAQQAQWVAKNCTDGSVSPSSSYYVPSAP